MVSQQIFKVIDPDIVNLCIKKYYKNTVYETDTMNKADLSDVVELLKSIFEKTTGKKLIYVNGNYYKHTQPYLPHTDYNTHDNNTLNIVVPLAYTNSQPSLVIFDQRWEQDSVTWCMHHPVQYFKYNMGVKGCPAEYPVIGLTDQDINEDLYKKYLTHYPKNLLKGLTGNSFPFEPGSIIVFDNRFIHCTSKLNGEKLGITFGFK